MLSFRLTTFQVVKFIIAFCLICYHFRLGKHVELKPVDLQALGWKSWEITAHAGLSFSEVSPARALDKWENIFIVMESLSICFPPSELLVELHTYCSKIKPREVVTVVRHSYQRWKIVRAGRVISVAAFLAEYILRRIGTPWSLIFIARSFSFVWRILEIEFSVHFFVKTGSAKICT